MGKQKRQERDRQKESDSDSQPVDSQRDPLGKLKQSYQVSVVGVLLASGMLLFVGLSLLGLVVLLKSYQILFFVGCALILCSLILPVINLFNFGRRLEVRKRGVRYVEMGTVKEFFWDDIVDIEIHRTDNTNFGVATRRRQSSDSISRSGPLTKTEWNIVIHHREGETIRLGAILLRTVRDPQKLIRELKMYAGI